MTQDARKTIGDESLENWEKLGSGAFGCVFKVKYKVRDKDVAIKLLHVDDSSGSLFSERLCREADHMEDADQQFVPRVYGMYKGYPGIPGMGFTERHGIVMELMEGGSLQSFLNTLSKPPPWPLVFRLAHQVALAMNFLHSKKELVHMDLKPDNVLLDANLNAKIADFGLSTVSNSVMLTAGKVDKGGTLAFTPPEAFKDEYHRVRSYDVYSYAILLWTILTGEKPYPDVIDRARVELRIPMGDRPDLKKIDVKEADGLKELVDLMKRCWDGDPTKRPKFTECIEVTHCVFSKHEKEIDAAVRDILFRVEPVAGQQQPQPSGAAALLAQPSPRVGNTNWCNCHSCVEMTTHVESVCCHDYTQTLNTMREEPELCTCITHHPGFQSVCLDVHVLRTAYNQWIQDHRADAEKLTSQHEKFRSVAYRQFVMWNWKTLGRRETWRNDVPVPSCAAHRIRQTFPNDAGVPYTGFKL